MKKIVIGFLAILITMSLVLVGCGPKEGWFEPEELYSQELPNRFEGVSSVTIDEENIEFWARHQNRPKDDYRIAIINILLEEGKSKIDIKVDSSEFDRNGGWVIPPVILIVNHWLKPRPSEYEGSLNVHADDITLIVWDQEDKDRLEEAIRFAREESKKERPSPLLPINVY